MELRGAPILVAEGVQGDDGRLASFSLGADATLLYVPATHGAEQRRLVWVDREGQEDPAVSAPRSYDGPQLSPDGRRLAVAISGEHGMDIWIHDLARNIPTRLTFDPGMDRWPVWTPDGRHVVFTSARDGAPNLYWKAVDGLRPALATREVVGAIIGSKYMHD